MTTNRYPRMVSWFQLLMWLMVGAMTLVAQKARAQTAISSEYKVKAAFLFNFVQFIQWPTNAFSETNAPMVIGILGVDPFGTSLDEIVRGESVNGHPLVVQRYRQIEDIKSCHILFVGESEPKRLEKIFTQVKAQSILTVGDTEEFARRGGMIGFFREKNKIRLGINLETVKQTGLEISSRLLRLAKIIPTGAH